MEEVIQVVPGINNLAYWEKKFQSMNFPAMDLLEATAYPMTRIEKYEFVKKFSRMKKDFLVFLVTNQIHSLRSAGLGEEDLFYLKKGILPENFTVHLKIPFDYTGTVDFSNFVLMQNIPYHDLIHSYLNMQFNGLNRLEMPQKLYVPAPVGNIYISDTNYAGSGGKSTSDRSAMAGYSAEAIKTMMMKNMPGR